MSLLTGIHFERNGDAQRGICMLLNAMDFLMFSQEFEQEVWFNSIKTIERALFRARMDAVLGMAGMRGQ